MWFLKKLCYNHILINKLKKNSHFAKYHLILPYFNVNILVPYQHDMEHFNKGTMTMYLLRSEGTMDV